MMYKVTLEEETVEAPFKLTNGIYELIFDEWGSTGSRTYYLTYQLRVEEGNIIKFQPKYHDDNHPGYFDLVVNDERTKLLFKRRSEPYYYKDGVKIQLAKHSKPIEIECATSSWNELKDFDEKAPLDHPMRRE